MPQPVPPAVTPAPPADIASIPDAVPRPEPRSARGNPPFYEVAGRRYTVLARSDNHIERGVASWYGPTFHGKSTSSGEPYDMYAMTAAHKTLPLPCYARVTNLANGRSVIVRINDRGPFVDNRIIDLSYTAAARLDMLRNGTAFVEVATITPGGNATGGFIATAQAQAAPPPADAPASARAPAESGLYIQIGAFGDEANAQRVLARLQAAGIDRILSTATTINGQNLRRIRVGPVGSVAEFDQLASRLETLGFADTRLALD